MRKVKTFLTLGLAALSLGILAQAPPRPPMGGPGVGPGPRGAMGPGGPDLLMDPQVQKQLHFTNKQIARLRALRPTPPRPGSKPPMPPRPGVEDAKVDAILTKTQRAQLRAIRAKRDRAAPGGPMGAPRPPKP